MPTDRIVLTFGLSTVVAIAAAAAAVLAAFWLEPVTMGVAAAGAALAAFARVSAARAAEAGQWRGQIPRK